MADKSNALSKKTIIAIVAIIVLLFIAGLSVGIFLADKGRTEAVDGNQTVAEENQTTDGNQATDGDQNADENQTDENQTADADQADGNNQEENNDNQTTTPDNNGTVVENNETANNGVVNNNVENNDGTANNNATNNNTVANNNGVTTNTDVNEVGETTVTRVEEQERLVSRDYWDWWTPTSVVAASASRVADKIVPTTPDFTVEKTASTGVMNADGEIVEGTETLVYAGQNITYTIRVTNNGSEDIENIEITDKIPQNTTFVSFDNVYNIVKGTEIKDKNDETVGVKWVVSVPGHEENEEAKSVIVKFTVKVNEMMPLKDENGNIVVDGTGKVVEVPTTGTIANTAIANGKESNEGEPTKTAIITNNKSSVITRNGEVVETAKIGDRIKYTITVTNTGDAEGSTCITDIVPTGTKLISVDGKEISADEKLTSVNWTVQLGAKGTETTTVSKEFVVEIESINGEIKNIGDVGGTPTNEDKNETADITVNKEVLDIKRTIDGVKTSIGKDAEVKDGDVIEYTITVKNNGSTDLTNVVVDEKLVGIKLNPEDLTIGDLKAGESKEISATYTVTYEIDIKNKEDRTISNEVVVSGETVTDPENPGETPTPVEDKDEVETIVEEAPSVSVVKTTDKTTGVKAGETINYTIVVTNTGNVTLTSVPVTDNITIARGTVALSVYSDEACTTPITSIEKMEVGEVVTLYTKYTVEQADIDNQVTITNIATAMNTPSDPVPTTPEEAAPSVDVVKIADKTTGVKVGDTINYTITITNDGNVTLTSVPVTDNITIARGTVALSVYSDEACTTPITSIEKMEVGEVVTLYTKYTVEQADIDNQVTITNIATAMNTPSDPVPTTPETLRPALTVDKTATAVKVNGSEQYTTIGDTTKVRPGDVIEYTITVTNTGNKTLENIKVTDSLKVTVDGVEKDLERQEDGSRASVIAIIESLSAEAGKNVETIKTYYTVVEADTVDSDPIHNEVKATVPDGPSGSDGEDVPVNPDTSVSGTKTWVDGGKTHDNEEEITLTLTRVSAKEGATAETVNATPTWDENAYTFSKLEKYDAEGYEYIYTVTEAQVDGYDAPAYAQDNANNITNTITDLKDVEISGTKTWVDGGRTHDNAAEITLTLTRVSAKAGATAETVNTTPTWNENEYTFSGLDKYDAEGYEYTYTVTETQVNGYDAPAYDSNNPNNITNTITDPMNIVVSGTKTWIDSNNAYGTRPDSIKVNLLQNGTKIKDATVKADKDGKWTYEFTGLAKYDAKGYEYTYTVTEDTVEGYTTLPIVKDTSTGKYNITNTLTLGITKSATDAAGNEITELTYDSNTPSSNNFNYVLTVTSQEKLEIPQTVTDILPTGITVAEEWERPSNVTVTTDAETGKQTITWTVDLSESTTTTLTIPVVADESLFSGKETEEETVISVLDLKFENKGTTYTGSKNSNSKGLNIFLRALDAANPNSDNGYIYAGNVEASDLVDRSTKFVTGYNDELVNQTLSSNDSNAIKAMLVDIAEDNADTENGLGRYLKNGLPSLTDINTTLTNLYGENIKISPTQVILWYKVPYSVDETLDRHYTISDENENQLFDGTISLPECAYHIDGIIVDISTLGGYIPKGTTVPVKNRATIGKIYDDATVDITYKPSELTNISVKKEWVDNSAEKPTSVTAQLFADGVEEGEPVVLNAGNSWSYDWTTLYKNKGEEEIEYTVKEIKVGTEDVVGNETSKYISTQEFDEETRTVTIINTRKAEIVSTKTASTENGTITIVQGQQNVTKEIPVEIGDTIEYTITVENKGALTEKDVTVQDTNPQHTTPISGSALEVTFNNGTTERKLTATEVQEFINGTFKVDVPAYTIFTFKFSVKVTDGSLTDKITNTAYVGGNPVGPTINSIERTVNVTKYKNNIASTNIILVLDVSSSMNNSRIVDARNAINTFVENTYAIEKNKNVTFTLLTFANRDYTEGKGATKGKPAYSANQKGGIFEFNDDGDYIVTYDNKDEFTNAVSGIVTDSGTNIRAGLEVTEKAIYGEDGNGGIAGMEEYKDYEQIVIFFGDGEPYGETEQLNNETGIKAKADDIRKKGAKIFSIGFGSDVSKPNSTGYKVLSKISDDGKVYTSSNYTDLVRDFSKIVGTDPSYDQITVNGNAIINITSNAQDIIVDADNPIIITVGGVSTIITSKADATANHITYTNKQITWDVSSYSESEALTITYYVQ